MKKVVYYFSGTGNSLYVARLISSELDCSYHSVTEYLNGKDYNIEYAQIVIVFPMYNHSYPSIIREFISKLSKQAFFQNLHISAVCTYGNDLGISLIQLGRLIKSFAGQLSLGYGIRMPYNYVEPTGLKLRGFYDSFVIKEHKFSEISNSNKEAQKKVKEIKSKILKKAHGEPEASSVFIETIVDRLGLQDTVQKKVWAKIAGTYAAKEEKFYDMVKHMDDGFTISEECTECGLCSSICPVGNITMNVDDKPEFNHNCEQCFACVSWCPTGAIDFRRSTIGRIRYHNPEVKVADMIVCDRSRWESL